MERIEDRSKALSYIGIEIAEALKYIPAPLDELEGVQNAAPVSPILENAKPKTIEKAKAKAIEKQVETVTPLLRNTVAAQIAATPAEEDNEEELYYEETRFEEKPSLWQKIMNSKFVRAVKFIMQIRVVLDYPALPEGRGENY